MIIEFIEFMMYIWNRGIICKLRVLKTQTFPWSASQTPGAACHGDFHVSLRKASPSKRETQLSPHMRSGKDARDAIHSGSSCVKRSVSLPERPGTNKLGLIDCAKKLMYGHAMLSFRSLIMDESQPMTGIFAFFMIHE